MSRSIREYMQVPPPDSRSNTSYGNAGGGNFSAPRMSSAEYPYTEPADDNTPDDMEMTNAIDTKAAITRYRPSSPRDSIADPSSFIDGSSRIHEDAPYTAGGSSTRIFTTGPGRHIGSTKGWASTPDPFPGDDDPVYTLHDIFDDDERYIGRAERDMCVIEALRPRPVYKLKQRK